jgi:hypothetical protein
MGLAPLARLLPECSTEAGGGDFFEVGILPCSVISLLCNLMKSVLTSVPKWFLADSANTLFPTNDIIAPDIFVFARSYVQRCDRAGK